MEARILGETPFPPTCAILASICIPEYSPVLTRGYAGELAWGCSLGVPMFKSSRFSISPPVCK